MTVRRRTYQEARAALATMQAARRITADHLAEVRRQIKVAAEDAAMAEANKSRHVARHCTSWTGADEARFQAHRTRLTIAREFELHALDRKIYRQDRAIAAFALKHGFNDVGAAA